MYVGELLPVVVLHDEIGFAFFNGPGRREAAGCQLLRGTAGGRQRPADFTFRQQEWKLERAATTRALLRGLR